MSLGANLVSAGNKVAKFGDRNGDVHNPIGSIAAAAINNLGDVVKGSTKLVMGLDYGIDAVKNGYNAVTSDTNTFLGYPGNEGVTRALDVTVQGAVAYTSAMIAIEGAGQLVSAVGQAIEDSKRRARAIS